MALTLVDLTNTVTGTIPAANGGTGATSFPAPGANGNALISNGTTWTSTAISTKPFVTGTSMLFRQTAAPTGWTKVTTYNDYALRIVSGSASTGGSVAFTTAFASQGVSGSIANTTAGGSVGTSGATTLSLSQTPSHDHSVSGRGVVCGGVATVGNYTYRSTNDAYESGTAQVYANGGGGSHTHSGGSFTGTAHNHSFTGTAINLAVQYVDVIIANID
jgi:hypothetical protein